METFNRRLFSQTRFFGQTEPEGVTTLEEAIWLDLTLMLRTRFWEFLKLVEAVRTKSDVKAPMSEFSQRFLKHIPSTSIILFSVTPEVALVVEKYVVGTGLDLRIEMPLPAEDEKEKTKTESSQS